MDSTSVRLDCQARYDEPPGEYAFPTAEVPVIPSFLSADTFRFELQGTLEASPAEGADLDPDALESPEVLDVTESDEEIHVSTGELTVEIRLTEWSSAVYDKGSACLLREQRDDLDAKSGMMTDALGFTAEQVNRWPYSKERRSE